MFDEEPESDPHGECAEEIHRLKKPKFLLIDKSERRPYAERYMLFHSFEECLKTAVERGYGDGSPFPVTTDPPNVGTLTQYACGDIDVSFMQVEIS